MSLDLPGDGDNARSDLHIEGVRIEGEIPGDDLLPHRIADLAVWVVEDSQQINVHLHERADLPSRELLRRKQWTPSDVPSGPAPDDLATGAVSSPGPAHATAVSQARARPKPEITRAECGTGSV